MLLKKPNREPSVGELWKLLGRLNEIYVAAREATVAKLWNLHGRLHEIHVAANRAICRQIIELTWSPPRDRCCCKERHL
jgi:hypothetical protein